MDKYKAVETRKIAVSGTAIEANFERQVNKLYVASDVDCFIDIDTTADTGGLLIQADQSPVEINAPCTRLSAITAGGTGSLYVMAVRTDK